MPDVLSPQVVANGVSGVTGQYDLAPLDVDELADLIRSTERQPAEDGSVERGRRLAQRGARGGLPWGVQPHDVSRAGWGVVFHSDESDAVREAVRPLIEHRRRQVGDASRVKELVYHTGETAPAWLRRYGSVQGQIEPTRVPLYLLWVGSPEQMPYTIAHHVDSEYCVGLLDLPSADDHAQYVRSVIAYETANAVPNTREAVFFGPRHLGDNATALSAEWLLGPLTRGLPADGATPADKPIAEQFAFRARSLIGQPATHQALADVLTGPPPSLLFTASHGMVWPNGDANQLSAQGALLCQDWSGIGQIARQHYFTADDVSDDASLSGLITFHFACYGAGTPLHNRYQFKKGQAPPAIAPRPFTAALPRRLLSHRKGSALACIGHVERAWGYSITGGAAAPHIRTFQRAIANLLVGYPAGLAVQEFNDVASTLSFGLVETLGDAFAGAPVSNAELVARWTHRNDAAGFVLLGDPAVRLRVNELV